MRVYKKSRKKKTELYSNVVSGQTVPVDRDFLRSKVTSITNFLEKKHGFVELFRADGKPDVIFGWSEMESAYFVKGPGIPECFTVEDYISGVESPVEIMYFDKMEKIAVAVGVKLLRGDTFRFVE